jgi:hypothetical protein
MFLVRKKIPEHEEFNRDRGDGRVATCSRPEQKNPVSKKKKPG